MIHATLIVQESSQLIEIYNVVKETKDIQILQIKNKLQTPLQSIHLNFQYNHRVIGEIQITTSDRSASVSAHTFLSELISCDTVPQFRQKLYLQLSQSAEERNVYHGGDLR